jgi:GNAT superfamily N-acetyltransferase
MGIAIRRAIEADWANIVALHRRAAVHERALTGLQSDADIADAQHRFRGDLYVAVRGERLAGFVAWARNEINWLYVDPAFFRRGVGEGLLQYALEHCGFVAHVRVLSGNRPMLELCRNQGFVPVDENAAGQDAGAILLRRVGDVAPVRSVPASCRTSC